MPDKPQPTHRPTITDVARASGVSKTTVSVILNGSPAGARVPEATRARVREAAERLGYRASWRGKALSNRRTGMIGVLYAPPMPLVVRGNYEGILAGIHEVLGQRGYHLLMVPLGDRPADWEAIIGDQRMDGAIILSRLIPELGDLVTRFRLPAALVNADPALPLPCVAADDFGGAYDSARHLISLSHQRIAFVMAEPPPHFSVNQRLAGYEAAMRDAGLERHIRVINAPAERIAAELGDATGVIAYTHYLAARLLQLLWRAGRRVPDDVSISGFTNAFPADETIPPLTTVALPTEDMGREVARMVLEQIDTAGTAAVRKVVLKETLVVRESTGPARAK